MGFWCLALKQVRGPVPAQLPGFCDTLHFFASVLVSSVCTGQAGIGGSALVEGYAPRKEALILLPWSRLLAHAQVRRRRPH